nr:immunoglobulin heavy chain junction region [Macaca mulatta]
CARGGAATVGTVEAGHSSLDVW